MDLFTGSGIYESHSGLTLRGKIECDALSDESVACIARWVGTKLRFGEVVAVPSGGNRFASFLHAYKNKSVDKVLIVDDVLTTGRSMEQKKREIEAKYPIAEIVGVVMFTRGKYPNWITPVFKGNSLFLGPI